MIETLDEDSLRDNGDLTIELIDEVRRFKSSNKIPLNVPLNTVNVYTNGDLEKIFNLYSEDIKGTLKISNLNILTGKPDVHENVIEVEPDMSKIGPEFRKDAGKIIGYINSHSADEIAKELEESGNLTIDDLEVSSDYLNLKTEVVGSTGEKVDIFQSEKLDIILEVIR